VTGRVRALGAGLAVWLLLVVAAVAAVGCGEGGSAEAEGGGTAPSTAPASTAPADDGPTPLSRRDAPPLGVARQLSHFGIGDGTCLVDPGEPAITYWSFPIAVYERREDAPPPNQTEAGEDWVFCVHHVPPYDPIALEVEGPEGYRITGELPPASDPDIPRSWSIPIGRELPRGSYTVTAQVDGEELRNTFDVVAPLRRGVRLAGLDEAELRAGEPIELIVIGFSPGDPIDVDVYRDIHGTQDFEYVTTLPTRIDADGIGSLTIPTSADDPRTGHVLYPRVPDVDRREDAAYFELR
jgi:hypothetical protein